MKPILEIQHISKRFRIAHELQPYATIRSRAAQIFSNRKSHSSEEFWALKDVSFDIQAGESFGIIGKNGAGKSTLLKILSKITPPTAGKIVSRGRIASLLEVGTGFHPELTGRENIFLNGSILGMKRKEILNKFDEIVSFSGVEKFLDTPLKHYSSGMQLRLAFAVAAFLEPEILIIDEVLAVGDAEFQKKCIGKMGEVSQSGRTILFVSHNMAQIQSLCSKGILLNEGKVSATGTIGKVISEYLSNGEVQQFVDVRNFSRAGIKNNYFRYESILINDGKPVYENQPVTLELTFKNTEKLEDVVLGFSVTDAINTTLIECRSTASLKQLNFSEQGIHKIRTTFNPRLSSGIYGLNIGARYNLGILEFLPGVTKLEIQANPVQEMEWYKASTGNMITESNWAITT